MNLYCDSVVDHVAPNGDTDHGIVSFDSTSSSFLKNVNDFCGLNKPKLVDYSSAMESFDEVLRLSPTSEPPRHVAVKNEHQHNWT